MSRQWEIDISFNICFTIVPPVLEPPVSERTHSFWSKFKMLSRSFWDPSKLVQANCKKHFKMKVLRFVLSIVTILSQSRTSLTLIFLLSGSTLYLLLTFSLVRYCHCFSYLTWMRNEHEAFLIIRLLNLMCI